MDPNESLDKFIENLIQEKGFVDLLPEVREQLKKDLIARIDDFISARVVATLSDEDLATFEQMLKDEKPQEELQQFTASHIPDFNDFVTNVLLEFKGVYQGIIKPPIASEASNEASNEATDKANISDYFDNPPPPIAPAPVSEELN